MSTFDDTGLTINRLADIQENLEDLFKASFGEDIKLGADSVFGQIIQNIALTIQEQNELLESVAGSLNPQNASGVPLSNLVLLNGIQRSPNVYSYATVTCTATKALTIPAGSVVQNTDTDVEWTTDADLVFAAAGSSDVGVTCTEIGTITATGDAAAVPGAPGSAKLVVIGSPLDGWTEVFNVADAVVGEAEETDTALRARRQAVAERASTVSISSVYGALSDVADVTELAVYENTGAAVDSNNVPPQHIWCIVKGGDGDDIAEAIFTHKAAGIGTVGDTPIDYEDATTGGTYEINYTIPDAVSIYIVVTLVKGTNYPDDGDEVIQQAVADYINDLTLGEDIIISRLYTPVNETIGHVISSIEVSRASLGAVASSDIALAVDEYAVIDDTSQVTLDLQITVTT